jgi:DNA (cytosine-5)-methyltransferase 1
VSKPRLLDLFCGAGGAAMGYARAGFEVVGVDIKPQPHYPFEFHQLDAIRVLEERAIESFDVIHASPPCQSYSAALRHLATPQPMLIDEVIGRLVELGLPWVVENVAGAPLATRSDLFGRHGVQLCGRSFGLPVNRHRLFETSFPLPVLPCRHDGLAMNPHNVEGRARGATERKWREAMGVEWMDGHEGREAIPPAYTEWIGERLLAALHTQVAAG